MNPGEGVLERFRPTTPVQALTDVLKILPLEFSVLEEVIGLGRPFWGQLFYSPSSLTL